MIGALVREYSGWSEEDWRAFVVGTWANIITGILVVSFAFAWNRMR